MRKMYSENQVGLIAKNVIKSGNVDNAKPVYIHPIVIVDTSAATRGVNVALFIFNNDPTPFTTWESLRDYIINIHTTEHITARILTTGSFIKENKLFVACHIYSNDSDICRLEGMKDNGSTEYISLYEMNLSVYDGVNKIN